MKNRIYYLDILKVLAIFCVVYTHLVLLGNGWFDHLTNVLTYIGVPLFFMVNGALLLNKKQVDFGEHLKKIVHIFLIFLCWKFLMVFICEIVFKEPLFPWTAAEFWNYMLGYKTTYHPTEAFWFFPALLSIYLVFPFIKKLWDSGDRRLMKYLCVLLFCFSFFPKTLGQLAEITKLNAIDFTTFDYYNPFGMYVNHLLYFILGGFLHKKYYLDKNYEEDIKIKCICSCIINAILLWIIKGFSTGFSGETQNGIPGYSMIPTLFLVSSIYILFTMTDLKEKKIVTYIADNTLGIYVLHILIGRIIAKFLYPIIPWRNFLMNGLKTVILIVLSLIIVIVMRKIPVVKKLVKI